MTLLQRWIVVLAAGLLIAARPGFAQSPPTVAAVPYLLACGSAAELEAALRKSGEFVAARGAILGGGPMPVAQFWINPQTQDWSVVILDPESGRACLVLAGTGFRADKPPARVDPPAKDRAS